MLNLSKTGTRLQVAVTVNNRVCGDVEINLPTFEADENRHIHGHYERKYLRSSRYTSGTYVHIP